MTTPTYRATSLPRAPPDPTGLGEPRRLAARPKNELRARVGRQRPSGAAARRRAARSARSFASSLALVLAFIAIGVAGMLWWQYRQFYVSLDQTDTAAAQALERMRAEQRALQDGIKDVNDDVATLRQLNASLGDRVDALPGRFADLERRLDAVQGGSFDARGDLLRSEAEYYLTVANTELTLASDLRHAITALELADGRLAELGRSRARARARGDRGRAAGSARRAPARHRGLMFSLGRLAARADELPLRADLPRTSRTERDAATRRSPASAASGSRSSARCSASCAVERRDEPVAQALSAAERALGRRQLELELEVARMAALRVRDQAFRSALDDGDRDLLQRDFDADSAEVEGALALLREMRALEIDPERPDISGSLNLLRELADGAR